MDETFGDKYREKTNSLEEKIDKNRSEMMGLIGDTCAKAACLYGGFIILVGIVCGGWLACSNNRFVRKTVDNQINNEILNRKE